MNNIELVTVATAQAIIFFFISTIIYSMLYGYVFDIFLSSLDLVDDFMKK